MKSIGLLLLLSSSQVTAKLGESHVQNANQQRELVASIEWSTNFPLKLCQGDCDSDFDCQGGLVCFQRNAQQAVPGCRGGEQDWSLTDYCVPKGWNQVPSQPQSSGGDLPVAYSTHFPLGRCDGDCDSDSDCQGNLKCFQRNGNTAVPGCIGGETDSSHVDYCIEDTSKNGSAGGPPVNTPPVQTGNPRVATYIGDQDFSAYPLGECQGDCDNDMDCLPGYFCWQRNQGEQMPYCVGASGAVDYCVPDSESPPKSESPPEPVSPGTKLKMYWDNYFWQETYEEAFWCMTCTECDSLTTGDGWEGGCKHPPGDKCEEGHLIWIHKCKDVRKRFDIVKNTGSGDQIRVHGTNLCFSNRDNRYLELRPCDKNIQNQLWAPMDNRKKFEIRPWNQRNRSSKDAKCVSQLHHPKATEVLSLRECWLNIHYETNYWMEYN